MKQSKLVNYLSLFQIAEGNFPLYLTNEDMQQVLYKESELNKIILSYASKKNVITKQILNNDPLIKQDLEDITNILKREMDIPSEKIGRIVTSYFVDLYSPKDAGRKFEFTSSKASGTRSYEFGHQSII